jgi:hypothetical protein
VTIRGPTALLSNLYPSAPLPENAYRAPFVWASFSIASSALNDCTSLITEVRPRISRSPKYLCLGSRKVSATFQGDGQCHGHRTRRVAEEESKLSKQKYAFLMTCKQRVSCCLLPQRAALRVRLSFTFETIGRSSVVDGSPAATPYLTVTGWRGTSVSCFSQGFRDSWPSEEGIALYVLMHPQSKEYE